VLVFEAPGVFAASLLLFARLAGRIIEARATTTIAIKAAVIFRFISLLLGKTRVCGSAVCRVWRFGKRGKAKIFDFKR
jgi:hypothetical protein